VSSLAVPGATGRCNLVAAVESIGANVFRNI
jgi:hypothetical protein